MTKQHIANENYDINGNDNLMLRTKICNSKTILEAVKKEDIFPICNIFNVPQPLQYELSNKLQSSGILTRKTVEKLFKKGQKLSTKNADKEAIEYCLSMLYSFGTNSSVHLKCIVATLKKANVPVYSEFGEKCTIDIALVQLKKLEKEYSIPVVTGDKYLALLEELDKPTHVVDENMDVLTLGELQNMESQ